MLEFISGGSGVKWHGIKVLSLSNSSVDVLTPNMIVVRVGAFGSHQALGNEVNVLINKPQSKDRKLTLWPSQTCDPFASAS